MIITAVPDHKVHTYKFGNQLNVHYQDFSFFIATCMMGNLMQHSPKFFHLSNSMSRWVHFFFSKSTYPFVPWVYCYFQSWIQTSKNPSEKCREPVHVMAKAQVECWIYSYFQLLYSTVMHLFGDRKNSAWKDIPSLLFIINTQGCEIFQKGGIY